MPKRNAIRITQNPHSAESIAYTIQRYGVIKQETLDKLIEFLESPEGKAERIYEIVYETISDLNTNKVITFPVIKTHMHGSAIEKFIDNEHDAQNTLANINNKDRQKRAKKIFKQDTDKRRQ